MIKLSAFADEAGSSLEEQIKALKRNGISLLELRSINGKNVLEFTLEEAKGYKEELDRNDIKVFSIGSPIGKVDVNVDFNLYLEKVKYVCLLARVFDTDKIRMFSFFNSYTQPEKVFKYLNEMVKVANSYGVSLYHENEKEIYGDTKERVLEIINNVKGLKFIYDPANYLQCGEKAQTTLELFHSKTDYFHIKDVVFDNGELVPAGYGDGMIYELINMIQGDKVLTIEPHLAVFDSYKSIDNTEMKHKFNFKNASEAFDFACLSLKNLLKKAGYKEIKGEFIK